MMIDSVKLTIEGGYKNVGHLYNYKEVNVVNYRCYAKINEEWVKVDVY